MAYRIKGQEATWYGNDYTMLSARTAEGDVTPGYERHRPEQTLLYQIVERHYPDFLVAREAQERPLPGYVQNEFEAFLKRGCPSECCRYKI